MTGVCQECIKRRLVVATLAVVRKKGNAALLRIWITHLRIWKCPNIGPSFTQSRGQESAAYNLYTQRDGLVQGIKYIEKTVKNKNKKKVHEKKVRYL